MTGARPSWSAETRNGLQGGGLESAPRLSLLLEAGAEAASEARGALAPVEGALGCDLYEDVRLLVSELVTNCIRHAGLRNGDPINVEVWIAGSVVRVEVGDSGPGFEPGPPVPDFDRAGGWGLYLVQQLAQRWGVIRNGGTCVWFEVDRRPVGGDVRLAEA